MKGLLSNTVKLCYNQELGPDQICVPYNRVDLCGKMFIWSEYFARYNQVFVITEFVITQLHCINEEMLNQQIKT